LTYYLIDCGLVLTLLIHTTTNENSCSTTKIMKRKKKTEK